MALTAGQKVTLKAHILANTDPTVVEGRNAGSTGEMVAWYSALSSPAFIVWRQQVPTAEVMTCVTWSGAGGFISRSQGERDAFRTMLLPGYIEPYRAVVRAAFTDIFSGSGAGAPETRAALLAISKRTATNIEQMFATGTGSDASPATLVYIGGLGYQDLLDTLAL